MEFRRLSAPTGGHSGGFTVFDLLQCGDSFGDRWMGVEEVVEPGLVVLERVVYAHGRRGMVELGERLIVGLQLLQRLDQSFRIAGQLDAAHVGKGLPLA